MTIFRYMHDYLVRLLLIILHTHFYPLQRFLKSLRRSLYKWLRSFFYTARFFVPAHDFVFFFLSPWSFIYQCKMSFAENWIQKLFFLKGKEEGGGGALTSNRESSNIYHDRKLNNRYYSINCILRSLRKSNFMCRVCCTNRKRHFVHLLFKAINSFF